MLRYISVLTVFLSATVCARGEDLIIGFADPYEVVTMTADELIDGDVVLLNHAQLIIRDGACLTVTGDMILLGATVLDVDDAAIHFAQTFSYQSRIMATEDSSLLLVDTIISGNGHSYGIGLTGSASAEFLHVTVVDGFATWGLMEGASAVLQYCVNTGEFLPFGDVTLTISDCDLVLLWLALFDGTVVDTTLPAPGTVAAFALDPSTPWATNIPYSVELSSSTNVMWGVMARSGSTALFHDSALRVVGTYFEHDNTVAITGLENNVALVDASFSWGDVSLGFQDSTVQTWNFYCFGSTHLTMENSTIGELLAGESGEAWMVKSLCDGSGGYVGATGNARVNMVASVNLSQTTVRENAQLVCWQSVLLEPQIDAVDDSLLLLLNTDYVGDPVVHHGATIFDLAIVGVLPPVSSLVSLRGSSRMMTGPTSPLFYQAYTVDFGVGGDPDEWFPIAGPLPIEVHDGELAEWYVGGLPPIDYTVRLSLIHTMGESISVTSGVSLVPQVNFARGDVNGDGTRNVADAIFLLAELFVPGSPPSACADAADINDDGARDISDCVMLLLHMFAIDPPAIPAPATCGEDPSVDTLGCDAHPACP